MKRKIIIKFNILIIMLALSAGLIFFSCGFFGRLPKGVIINGVDVGGKSAAQAAERVREDITVSLKQQSLTVHGARREYVFTYPEINFKDNLQTLIKSIKNAGEYTAEVRYYLNGLNEITAYISADESIPVTEPYAIFNAEGEPFTYFEGNDGTKADRAKLSSDIRLSLESGFPDVYVKTKILERTRTVKDVKYDTSLLSAFTTYFDGENSARVHNIRLAADKINGTILESGSGFSFNSTVGERTAQRGFAFAKIIENGEFVDGVGGGVCQVSTTLYNAALLCGCKITEYHPHSLAVSYVPPSFDAMVSGNYYDLKFENKTGYNLYIRAEVGSHSIKFSIYGRGDGAQYGYSSRVTGNIPAPEEITSDISLVKSGKDGTVSEGYLTVTRNGMQRTVLLRRDKYAPVKRIVLDTAEEIKKPSEEG